MDKKEIYNSVMAALYEDPAFDSAMRYMLHHGNLFVTATVPFDKWMERQVEQVLENATAFKSDSDVGPWDVVSMLKMTACGMPEARRIAYELQDRGEQDADVSTKIEDGLIRFDIRMEKSAMTYKEFLKEKADWLSRLGFSVEVSDDGIFGEMEYLTYRKLHSK